MAGDGVQPGSLFFRQYRLDLRGRFRTARKPSNGHRGCCKIDTPKQRTDIG